MIVKRVLILANSRKLSGRCIAGREIANDVPGPWIRPVSAREHGEVSEYERQFEDGRDPRVLDVVDIPLLEHRPEGYQKENWLLDPETYWVLNRRATPLEIGDLVDPINTLWVDGYSTYNGANDQVPIAIAAGVVSSLRLIRVTELTLSVFASGAVNLKRRVQAKFTHHGTDYALWVTDPGYEREFRSREDGDYKLGPCFLTVSLGEEFQGNAYKLVSAIIPVTG